MMKLARTSARAMVLLVLILGGCGEGTEEVTQTSEVVVYDEEPAVPPDPFDAVFMVDGERALRLQADIAPPRLVSRGPRVRFPSSERRICFPRASIIVVVDKTGAVRETEIITVAPAIEYVAGERRTLGAEESRALIEEREFAIHNWKYEPAMKDGQPVPVLVEGGWQMPCR